MEATIESLYRRARGSHPGPPGCLERLVNEHPDPDAFILWVMFFIDVKATVVSEHIKEEMGIWVGPHTINRHRRGDCRCDDRLKVPFDPLKVGATPST